MFRKPDHKKFFVRRSTPQPIPTPTQQAKQETKAPETKQHVKEFKQKNIKLLPFTVASSNRFSNAYLINQTPSAGINPLTQTKTADEKITNPSSQNLESNLRDNHSTLIRQRYYDRLTRLSPAEKFFASPPTRTQQLSLPLSSQELSRSAEDTFGEQIFRFSHSLEKDDAGLKAGIPVCACPNIKA